MGTQYLKVASFVCFVFALLNFPHIALAKFLDGLGVYGGVYVPLGDSMDKIYGSGFKFGMQYKSGLHRNAKSDMGLAMSIDFLQKEGDPYNDGTFTATDAVSRLTFVPVEISYIVNLVSNEPTMGRRIRSLYNAKKTHTIYRSWGESHLDSGTGAWTLLAKGNAFGSQALAGIDFLISSDLVLAFELKRVVNRPLMKLDSGTDYRVKLDGTQVQAMVMWNLGS